MKRSWRVTLRWRDQTGRGTSWETSCDLSAPDWETALRLTREWRGKDGPWDFTGVEVEELSPNE